MRSIAAYVLVTLKILFCSICLFSIFVATTNTGRNAALNAVSFIMKTYYSTDVCFSKLEGNHIEKISITSKDGSSYCINNVTFSFSPKLSLEADNIAIKSADQHTNIKELFDKLRAVIPTLQKYVNTIKIKSINDIHNFDYTSSDSSAQCSATVKNVDIKISIDEKRCIVLANDNEKSLTVSLDDLFKENIIFKAEANDNLLNANGTISNDFSQANVQGTVKNVQFSSNIKVDEAGITFDGDISNIIPKNEYLWPVPTLKFNGSWTSQAYNINFRTVDDKELSLTGVANNNGINADVKWLDFQAHTRLMLKEKTLYVNELSVINPALKITLEKPIVMDLDKTDHICGALQCGRIAFSFNNLQTAKTLPQAIQKVQGNGTGHVYIKDSALCFDLSSENLSYKAIECNGLSGTFQNDNLKLLFKDIKIKKHKISGLSVMKTGDKVEITGDIDDHHGGINIKTILAEGRAIVNKLEISGKDINVSSNKIDIIRSKDNLNIVSDKIDLFDGSAAIDFSYNAGRQKLKLTTQNIHLKNLLFFIDNKERKLLKNVFLTANIDVYSENNKYLGIADFDMSNEKKITLLDSRIKMSADSIFLSGKFSDNNDFIETDLSIPAYLSCDTLTLQGIKSQKLSGIINASIDLKKFLFFSASDRLNLKGLLEVQLSLSEIDNTPILSGTCNVSNGLVETPSVSIRNIFINTSIKNNKITINRATSTHKKGKMTITGGGHFKMDNIIPQIICDMNVSCDHFDLLSSDSLKCDLTGTVKATGPIRKLTLKGPLNATNGVYDTSYANTSYNSDIKVTGIHQSKIKALTTSDSNSKVPFIFDLTAQCRNFRVTGKSVEATLNGELKILTIDDMLALNGQLKLDSGYINMVGSRIKLRSGYVKFENKLMPLISLHGNSIVKDMQIFLDIDNTKSQNLSIDIKSNPTYSIENIFSKIVFNKPLIGLKLSESAKIRNAVKSLKQQRGNAFSYFDFLKELMIFDSFSFSNEDPENSKNGTNTLSAGKYISDNIYIGLEKATEKETKYKVAVNISPQVKVEANSSGEAGITWMYRY